jgi:exopolyphosphatase/guanosine-5'-triphosphate,3'-diphosphate pyrophosphatase
VRAVATAAFRQARNGREVAERLRRATGVALEIVSGREEARLVCAAALAGARSGARSLVLDVGGGSTEIVLAEGKTPVALWSLGLGAVRLAERAAALDLDGDRQTLGFVRYRARDVLEGARLQSVRGKAAIAVGTSGTIRAVVDFASDGGREATAAQIRRASGVLAGMGGRWRRRLFERRRADVIVAGAAVLEAVVDHLGLERIEAIEAGLREGVARDLLGRHDA